MRTEAATIACYRDVEELGMEKDVLFFLYAPQWVPRCLALNPAILVMPRARNAAKVHAIKKAPRIRVIHIDGSFYDATLVGMMRERGVCVLTPWS